ncbi:unnamed protein product [Mytilus edulis]|uniref:Uncharacterized protein n=1 Tax=Mytilus edulis TaxID=6550 RepID=A0A8S3TUQ3_MYTED|nr:unnamed protein product [Mytilus edulis]
MDNEIADRCENMKRKVNTNKKQIKQVDDILESIDGAMRGETVSDIQQNGEMAQVRLHEETVKWMAKFDDLDEIIVKQHLLNFTVLIECVSLSRLQDITVGRAVKKVCSTKNLSFVVRVRSGKEVCTFEKDELSNSFKIKTTEKEIGKIEDTSHEFTEEKPGAKIFTKGNRSGITNEYKLTFSEKLSVSEKTLILAGSFLADIFCIDNGLLRWNYSNEQTGASYDIVFKNSKYNKSMYIPGRALVINQISPLI